MFVFNAEILVKIFFIKKKQVFFCLKKKKGYRKINGQK